MASDLLRKTAGSLDEDYDSRMVGAAGRRSREEVEGEQANKQPVSSHFIAFTGRGQRSVSLSQLMNR